MRTEKYNKYKYLYDYIIEYSNASNAATGSKFDSNANVDNKNVCTLSGELYKKEAIGVNRYCMIKKLTELYGSDLAEEYIRQLECHEKYRHDETHPLKPYCVSITLYPFLLEGLKTLGAPSSAPHHLDSFCGNFINLIYAVSSQFAGACSAPEYLAYMDYFIRKDYGDDYYLRADEVVDLSNRKRTLKKVIIDHFEQIAYSINEPAAARDYQSVK